MRHVEIETLVPSGDADAVFARISDFERYADHTDAVREVAVTSLAPDLVESRWAVNFRNGVLAWSERDRIDPAARTIAFEQIAGDFHEFTGTWGVTGADGGVAVVFTADFDLGMPSLAPIIDPIAERALRENMMAILRGLLGDDIVFLDDVVPEPSAAGGTR
jgi:ribosome-associated toxin RatA of RatAB toxin-antitoxin module